MPRQRIRLSRETFALTWRYAEVPELPTALHVPMPGGDLDGQARAEIRATVEVRDLAGPEYPGFLRELEDAYRLLATAPVEFYGWVVDADGSCCSVHVACHPRRTLFATLDDDTVVLADHPPSTGAAVLAATLPHRPAAELRPVSARMADVVANERSDGSVLRQVRERAAPDVALLRRVCATTARGKGQLYVAVRTAAGRRLVSPPLHYLDPDEGRILFYTAHIRGAEYLTALPDAPAAITERLEQLRAELAA